MAKSLMVRWRKARVCCMALVLAGGGALLVGCAQVPSGQHRLVAKANMQFHGAAMFSSTSRLLTQFESSAAAAVGGQAGGGSCSACGD